MEYGKTSQLVMAAVQSAVAIRKSLTHPVEVLSAFRLAASSESLAKTMRNHPRPAISDHSADRDNRVNIAAVIEPMAIYAYPDKLQIWVPYINYSDLTIAYDCLCRHVVKKNHREQGIRFVGCGDTKTRCTGPRTAPE